MNKTVIKYAVGFGVFFLYFLLARNIENKIKAVAKLAGNNVA